MEFHKRYKQKHYPNAMNRLIKCKCGVVFKYKDVSSLYLQVKKQSEQTCRDCCLKDV